MWDIFKSFSAKTISAVRRFEILCWRHLHGKIHFLLVDLKGSSYVVFQEVLKYLWSFVDVEISCIFGSQNTKNTRDKSGREPAMKALVEMSVESFLSE